MAFASLRGADMLVWRQPGMFSPVVEVLRDEALAGILRYSHWGMTCDATCADGMWTFRRHGFLWSKISITKSGSSGTFATYHSRFVNGTIRLESGDSYGWRHSGIFSVKSAFATSSGFSIATFAPKVFSLRSAGSITIAREYANDPNLPFLILLGTHFSLQRRRRRA